MITDQTAKSEATFKAQISSMHRKSDVQGSRLPRYTGRLDRQINRLRYTGRLNRQIN